MLYRKKLVERERLLVHFRRGRQIGREARGIQERDRAWILILISGSRMRREVRYLCTVAGGDFDRVRKGGRMMSGTWWYGGLELALR